ncbi:MAG: hypothetical protein WA960_06070 [Tunicatimonas sp.]
MKPAQSKTSKPLRNKNASLPMQEANLLLKINQYPSLEAAATYQALLIKRQEGMLSDVEHQELIGLNEKYEQLDAKRAKYLIQLAKLRGVSLSDLMNALVIPRPTYG